MQMPNLGIFGGKKEEKPAPQAKAANTADVQSFNAVLNHAGQGETGSARTTLGQLKQEATVDLQQQEQQLVMKQINDRLKSSETTAMPAQAAVSALPSRPLMPNLKASA